MVRALLIALALSAAATAATPPAPAAAQAAAKGAAREAAKGADSPPAPLVFFDIAGPDMAKQAAFYRDVFGWKSGPGGALIIPTPGGALPGALRQDPKDKILYLGVDDIAAALAEVKAHGGQIVQPRFAIKGVAILALFTDPAGNSMGLVEMQGGKVKVP